MTRPYRLYWTLASSSDNVASVRITRDGCIRAIHFMLAAVAGAGITGRQQIELSKQSTSSITVNDPGPAVIAEASIAYPVNGIGTAMSQVLADLDVPVRAGETLYVHQILSLPGPTAQTHSAHVYVNES